MTQTFSAIARNASEAAYPHLRRGLVGAWVPSLGVTGATLRDVSGGGNHGDMSAKSIATDWQQGGEGWSVYYPQTSGEQTFCGNDSALNPRDALSMAVWMKADATASTYQWVIARDDNALGRSFAFGPRYALDSKLWLQINGGSTLVSSSAVSKSEWHHVAATGSASTGWRIYLDGKLDGSRSFVLPSATTGQTTIGGRSYIGSEGVFKGLIADAMLYSRVLTQIEIAQLYRLGPGGWLARKRRRVYSLATASVVYGQRLSRHRTILGGGLR